MSESKTFVLPDLPYPKNGLEPHISQETIEFHYGKHHATYVNTCNSLLGTIQNVPDNFYELIKVATPGKFKNSASQAWNHSFYWYSMIPNGGKEPTGQVKTMIDAKWGDFDKFKTEFTNKAVTHFGSGWCWLVYMLDSKELAIIDTHDAITITPETHNAIPLLTCDVWEHAYYIDKRNNRKAYVDAWWNLVNWDSANKVLASGKMPLNGTV